MRTLKEEIELMKPKDVIEWGGYKIIRKDNDGFTVETPSETLNASLVSDVILIIAWEV